MTDQRIRKRGIRAVAILICVAGLTISASVMWGLWPSLMAFFASYGLTCLFDGLEPESAISPGDYDKDLRDLMRVLAEQKARPNA